MSQFWSWLVGALTLCMSFLASVEIAPGVSMWHLLLAVFVLGWFFWLIKFIGGVHIGEMPYEPSEHEKRYASDSDYRSAYDELTEVERRMGV
ncbi:hypothetical protein FACS18949_08940 [Clostridia bacterium]|nr:hypothetical protein FACS189425_11140 [Clostridia bacterium]GHV33891.1 hypothetical protein FACS18949_08940 [Clostridia bacterium]